MHRAVVWMVVGEGGAAEAAAFGQGLGVHRGCVVVSSMVHNAAAIIYCCRRILVNVSTASVLISATLSSWQSHGHLFLI